MATVTVAELVAKIAADTSSLNAGINRANGHLDRFEKKSKKSAAVASKAFAIAGVAIAGALAGIAATRALTNVITTFEKLEASLKTVTGSAGAASAAFDQIQKFAATTPFQLEEVVASFIKLKALGLDPSEEALRAYGNTASAMGKSLNQMIEAIADAATGEFERLKEFGIKARSEGDNVTFTFQGVATTVRKSASDIEGYLRSIGKVQFGGAMEEQADTLNVSISNLGDSWDKFLKSIGDAGATAAFKSVVDGLRTMSDSATEIVKRFDSGFKAGSLGAFMFGDEKSNMEEREKELQTGLTRMLENLSSAGSTGVNFMPDLAGAFEKQQAGILSALGIDPAKIEEELALLTDSFLTKEELEIQHHENRLTELAGFLEQEKSLTADQKADIERLEDMHRKKIESINKQKADKEFKDGVKGFQKQISMAANHSKAFFQIQKAANLAQATIDGYAAVQGAYKVGNQVGGPVVGAAFAATAAVASAINIKAIAGASFGGGGGTPSGGGGGSLASGATPVQQVDTFGIPTDTQNGKGAMTFNISGFTRSGMREFVEEIQELQADGFNIMVNEV